MYKKSIRRELSLLIGASGFNYGVILTLSNVEVFSVPS